MEIPRSIENEQKNIKAWRHMTDELNRELGIAGDPDKRITIDTGCGHFVVPIFDMEKGKRIGENFIPLGDHLTLADEGGNPTIFAEIADILRAVQQYPRLGTKEALENLQKTRSLQNN